MYTLKPLSLPIKTAFVPHFTVAQGGYFTVDWARNAKPGDVLCLVAMKHMSSPRCGATKKQCRGCMQKCSTCSRYHWTGFYAQEKTSCYNTTSKVPMYIPSPL